MDFMEQQCPPRKAWVKPEITGVSSLRSAEGAKQVTGPEAEFNATSKGGPAS